MLGFLSSINQMRSQAKAYKHQGQLLTLQAKAARTQANAQAALIELQGQQQQEIANRNLRTARENQRAEVGTARTLDATSGFTSEGSGSNRARQTQLALDAEIENMALSASIASHNSWQRARDTIKQGEITAMTHEMQAEQMNLAAKATRKSMLYTSISGALGAIGGAAIQGYANTAALNETITTAYNQGQFGEVGSQAALEKYNNNLQSGITWDSNMLSAAYTGLNTAAGAANAFNPYTATMTPAANNRKNNWAGNLAVLLGRTPYTTPQAGNVFSLF